MFVDMRGSTRLAEKRLPYDTVFLINQFLTAVSHGVIEAGGDQTRCSATACWPCSVSSPPGRGLPAAVTACAAIAANVEGSTLR